MMPLQKTGMDRLHKYIKKNTDRFPKLIPALRSLEEFVGHEDIKETVVKMVLFYISQCATVRPLRRSKRRRTCRKKPKRRRIFSTDDEDEEYKPEQEQADVAKTALIALLTHSLQAGQESSDEEEEVPEDPPYVAKCKERMDLLQGHFVHTMLLGNPGTGKTTFASILVNVWDALGIIDKRRYMITKRSDWVGKYQGHSCAKAKKLIESAKGGVIFIDEAYSIISSKDGDDMYGREVLTEIVEAMSNPDKQVIFIMAGYENDMKQLFTHNAGLERRFGYVFRFKSPAALMIESVFHKQLRECKWKTSRGQSDEITSFFKRHHKKLTHGGGSTKQLIFHSKQSAIVRQFPDSSDSTLTLQDLEDGLKTFSRHAQVLQASAPPPHMYL